MLRRSIPNLFTIINLLCGTAGVILACSEQLLWAACLICAAAAADFLDGFCARLLKVQSAMGKQLDSLADMVTFGVLPGVILFQLITIGYGLYFVDIAQRGPGHLFAASLALLVPVFAGLRLARFNVDESQSHSFLGLPTPANAVLIASFPLILEYQFRLNMYHPLRGDTLREMGRLFNWDALEIFALGTLFSPGFYMVLSVVMALLMVAPMRFFSFKFKSFGWASNRIRYIFLAVILAAVVVVFLPYLRISGLYYTFLDFIIIPILLFLYLILSVLNNLFKITDEVQS
ncbi:MAG: CDP-alcohol phosphatidyltransferase family protein [Bacteroidota bacterium]